MRLETTKKTFIHIILSIITVLMLFSTFFSFNQTIVNPALAQVGGQCRFDQASCTWDAEPAAVTYSVTVVEEDSGQTIKQETVPSGTTKLVFPVTANKTYRCDVAAVNACGTLGPAGSASALCAVEGMATPAPSVAASVAPTVAPTTAPTQPPAPRAKVGCGSSCATADDCQTGLTCLKIGNGDSYCARPEYQAACVQNPTLASCCQPPRPTAQPTLPPSGLVEDTMTIIMVGLVIAVLGFGGILLTARKRR